MDDQALPPVGGTGAADEGMGEVEWSVYLQHSIAAVLRSSTERDSDHSDHIILCLRKNEKNPAKHQKEQNHDF